MQVNAEQGGKSFLPQSEPRGRSLLNLQRISRAGVDAPFPYEFHPAGQAAGVVAGLFSLAALGVVGHRRSIV
jgi:hypothetical protein